MAKNKQKKNKYKIPHKCRHSFFYRLLRPLVVLFLKIKFKYKFKKVKGLKKENYIILSNHTTDYDLLFVASSFKRPMYFVGSEHITRFGAYPLLKFLFNPIVRFKGSVGSTTVMEILRRIRGGANVCMFAEGIRSWDGVTSPILPSTAKLIRSAGCGLVTYKITGGYFVSPNWSEGNGTRKGKVYGAPVRVYSKEEIYNMSDSELFKIINDDLYENAYDTQLKEKNIYKGKKLAEKLENLIFVCPHCKHLDTINSVDDTIICTHCANYFKYNEYGMLEETKFQTVKDLSDWQKTEISKHFKQKLTYSTEYAKLYKLSLNHEKSELIAGKLTLNPNELQCGEMTFNVKDIIDLNIHGRHSLVFSVSNNFYEIDLEKKYNAYKYVLYYKEITKEK